MLISQQTLGCLLEGYVAIQYQVYIDLMGQAS
jgi:hypothetical protein